VGALAVADEAPAPGTARPVADGVWWVRLPLPFALDHVNVWLVDGADGWTLVDCGLAWAPAREALAAALDATLRGRPLRRVLVTHYHPDHVGLAHWACGRHGARLLMPRAEWLLARVLGADRAPALPALWRRFYAAAGLPAEPARLLEERGNAYPRGVPAVPDAAHRLRGGDRVSLGGPGAWAAHTTGGHAPEHASLWRARDRVLLAGDAVLPRISPNVSVWPGEPDADPVADFLAGLRQLAALDDRPDDAPALVLPAHGAPYRGLARRCAELAAHHAERLALVEGACRAAPRTAWEVTTLLFPRPLDAHQLSFAVGEAVAHLNHLVAAGRLARGAGAGGVDRYGPPPV
jgi:glyoxylase-like metal-dependent hydrolase (beta-lactamase superfamily II)